MYILFTKKHPSGISKGSIKEVADSTGKMFIDEGFAKKSTEKDRQKYVSSISKGAKPEVKEAKEESKDD